MRPGAVRRDDRGAPRPAAAPTSPMLEEIERDPAVVADTYPYLTLLAGKENAKAAIRWAEQALRDPRRARMRRILLAALAAALVAAGAAGAAYRPSPLLPLDGAYRLADGTVLSLAVTPDGGLLYTNTRTGDLRQLVAAGGTGPVHLRARLPRRRARPRDDHRQGPEPDARDRWAHPHGPPDRGQAPGRLVRRPGRAPGREGDEPGHRREASGDRDRPRLGGRRPRLLRHARQLLLVARLRRPHLRQARRRRVEGRLSGVPERAERREPGGRRDRGAARPRRPKGRRSEPHRARRREPGRLDHPARRGPVAARPSSRWSPPGRPSRSASRASTRVSPARARTTPTKAQIDEQLDERRAERLRPAPRPGEADDPDALAVRTRGQGRLRAAERGGPPGAADARRR